MLKEVDESIILLCWEEVVRNLNISQELLDLQTKVICSEDYLKIIKNGKIPLFVIQ